MIKEERMLKHGCKHYVLEDVLTGQILQKTEFPDTWDMHKMMKKIIENFDNVTGLDKLEGDSIIRFIRSDEGIPIKCVIDKYKDKYILKTAIPWFK